MESAEAIYEQTSLKKINKNQNNKPKIQREKFFKEKYIEKNR